MAWALGRSPANQIVSVPLALATKQNMFWALARVSFRAAKIVSCNKKRKNSWSTMEITSIVQL
jgi:hypothetical protein